MARGLADLRQVLPHDTVTLTRLLERRPDVLGPPPPLDLDELADRLDDPYSVVSALQSASLPVIQCAQAAVGLGGRTSLAQVSALLGSDPAIVVPFLTWLHERFLLRLDGSEVLAPPGLVSAVGDPLGLGPALADLLEEQTVDGMRRMLLLLGQPRPVRKADVVAALGALLRDPDWVRATISSAPEQVRGWLLEVAADNSDDTDQHPTYDLAAHRAARCPARSPWRCGGRTTRPPSTPWPPRRSGSPSTPSSWDGRWPVPRPASPPTPPPCWTGSVVSHPAC